MGLITQITDIKLDWTKFFDYQQLVAEEIEEYSSTEVTDRLLLGGIHANPAWEYWFQFLEQHWRTHFGAEVINFANQQSSPKILSLGCGHGGFEIAIASQLHNPYQLMALDLNPYIWKEAQQRIRENNLNIEFKAVDLNFVAIAPNSFDVIFAHASLHHMLNLEHLMSQIYHGLKSHGRFIILDMIGEVQTLFWPENVDFARSLVEQFPDRLKSKFSVNPIPPYQPPALQVGMEGIRQEELELEIDRFFTPIKCFKYNSFMRLIGTNPILGNIFDLQNHDDRNYLEELCRLDLEQVNTNKLRPTEMFAVYEKRGTPPPEYETQARIKFLQNLLLQRPSPSTQPELTRTTDLENLRKELANLDNLTQLYQTEISLLKSRNIKLKEYITWMQGSKFWRLRQIWQLLKSIFTNKNIDALNPIEFQDSQ